MKKIFTLLLLLAAIVPMQAQNEQKMFLWKNDTMQVLTTDIVDSITFTLADDAITFTTGDAYYITENSFKAAFTMNSKLNPSQSADVEIGVCWSRKYKEPTIKNPAEVYQTKLSNKLSWAVTFEDLYSGTSYYYRPYAMIDSVVFYGDVKSVSTYGAPPTEIADEDEECPVGGSHYVKYVDLGLSVKWADRNLGASKPEEYGNYYAWGETKLQGGL